MLEDSPHVAVDDAPPEFTALASEVPADPEPSESDDYQEAKHTGREVVTAATRNDVQGKVAFFLGMLGSTISLKDNVCGPVFNEQAPIISEKLTPIICRSPDMVKWFTKTGGGFIEWLDLIVALWPVIEAMAGHHLMQKKKDTRLKPDPLRPPDYTQYPAA